MDNHYYLLALLLVILPLVYRAFSGSRVADPSLRLPPGPWQLPVLGSLHHLYGALPHRALRDLSRRHGPLMLIKFGAKPVIIASSAEAAKEIMKTHDIHFCTRPLSSTLKVMGKHSTGVVFAPYGEKWRLLRKICFLELLSDKRVASFRKIREEEATRLVRSISSAAATTEPLVNMNKMLATHVTDTVVHAIMGARFKENDTLIRYVHDAAELAGGFNIPDLFPSSRLARTLCSTLRRADAYRDSLMVFMDGVIAEHLETRRSSDVEHQEDLIDVLLRIKGEGNLQFPTLTMSDIKIVIFDLFGGGTEAPQTTLLWAMAELMHNPSVMARAQAEVRGAFKAEVTEDGLSDLSYMRCVIKETMRLHIPGPFLIPRECQQQCRILGYDVPKGATVLVNAWAIARDPEFWHDPEAFLPDRFLGNTTDFRGNHFQFTPFGAGRRMCPGIEFGIRNFELTLASLLFYFDWSLPDGILPSQLDMAETMGFAASKRMDLWVRPTLRVDLPR